MKAKNSLEIVRFATDIIQTETEAISKLSSYIDDDFVSVCNLIFGKKGRVIITGIGKSAIIANKITATLNSTGTPSMFLHAADAIHGDLGMIQSDDTVICISKSGNTPEIKVLIPLIRNLGKDTKIVALVGNTGSFLAINSDYILNSTVEREACPMNLAPTSSTTAQLVMGDALSMTLVYMRGFSSSDFAKVHPGGALGKKLYLTVSDLISKNMTPQVSLTASINEVIIEISSKMLGATAVIDNKGDLAGVITDGDLRRMLQSGCEISNLTAENIMSKSPKHINSTELAVNAFSIMESNKITQLLVLDSSNKYCGIVHIHNVLQEGLI